MRGIQYAAASRLIISVSRILDHPLEPVIGLAEGETRWRMMTARINFKQPRPSLRATGSRECAPDDGLREAIQLLLRKVKEAGLLSSLRSSQ
jgi:hypothetical protein